MINLDNAATTGHKPQEVISAVERALKQYSANPGRGGHKLSVGAGEAAFYAREKIAGFFGASGGERVIFTANCTAAVNYVIKGFLRRGDHVIISDLEHNAVMRPIEKAGIEKSIAAVDMENDNATVENFRKLIKENTKMIFCTAASNVCGKALPLKKLGKLCRENGIAFGVDAAQAAGIMPINMKDCGIDFLCIAPHKGLYAPMGLGILVAGRDIGDTLIEGGTGTNSKSLYQPDDMPERYESGTIALPAVMGAAAGVDFVEKHAKSAYFKEMRQIRYIYDSFAKLPYIRLYTPFMEDGLYVPVLSFNVDGMPSESVADYLDKRGIAVRAGLHCAPAAHRKLKTDAGGTVRIAPSIFTADSEIRYLVRIIKDIYIQNNS